MLWPHLEIKRKKIINVRSILAVLVKAFDGQVVILHYSFQCSFILSVCYCSSAIPKRVSGKTGHLQSEMGFLGEFSLTAQHCCAQYLRIDLIG